MQALADKVVAGIAAESGSSEFNGVHLRMERDAMDWAMILGGRNRYWALYRSSMSMAHFSKNTPLFVASGLLKGSTNINTLDGTTQGDTWSVQQMKQLAREIVQNKVRLAQFRTSSAVLAHEFQKSCVYECIVLDRCTE